MPIVKLVLVVLAEFIFVLLHCFLIPYVCQEALPDEFWDDSRWWYGGSQILVFLWVVLVLSTIGLCVVLCRYIFWPDVEKYIDEKF